ncbi:interferon-induced protein 44-like [Anoplopoma fimbria]|uniref:interferon-induced protein 44-like n=1 Tax=Anoplopoma fimbria TaxID=229290 RepID=UPI0023ED389B|nr:interferon-induced protein 44-like [Anoplopoma fimbria]
MGFEKMTNRGVNVEDVKLAMKGHVPDGYKFDPEVQFQDDDDDYNSCPTLDDRVHVLVCVVPADNVSLMSPEVVKKMREVREAASEMGIPQLAILTKVDKAYPQLATDINEVYNHKDLKQKVDELSMLIGMPPNCFFLVKNYHSETNTNEDIDVLILKALREIITFGEDFLNNL